METISLGNGFGNDLARNPAIAVLTTEHRKILIAYSFPINSSRIPLPAGIVHTHAPAARRPTPATARSSATNQDRQAIIRQLIEYVVVTVQGNSEIVDVSVHWIGGFVSQHQIIRPVGRYEQLRDYDRLVARLRELRATGYTNREIAELLNHEGFHTPKCDQQFDAPLVQRLTSRCGLPSRRKDATSIENPLKEHQRWVPDLAREVWPSPGCAISK